MRRILITAAAALTAGLQLTAAPPAIIWQPDEKRPEVIDDRANIVMARDSSGNAAAAFAADTLAGQVAATGYIITWAPKWHFQGTGGVRLPDAAVSADHSVLTVLETAGEEQGPWQSRIVCISPKTGKVLRIVELKERKVETIRLLPGTTEALLYQTGQSAFKQSNRLLKVNLANGLTAAEYTPFTGDLESLAINADGSKAAAKLKDSPVILVYDLNDPAKMPEEIDSGFKGGALGFSPDNESVLAAADGRIYFFNLLNIGTQTRDPLPSPEGFLPDILRTAADRPGEMLVGQTNGPLYLLRGGRSFLLDDSCEGFAEFAGNLIMLVSMGHSTARFLDRNTLNETGKLQIKADRPTTRGNLMEVFFSPNNGLLALDSQGNIYARQSTTGRKWAKKLLFEAKK